MAESLDSPTNTAQEVNPEEKETTESDVGLGLLTEKPSEIKSKPSKSSKIDILLKPTPNAPIMAKKKWSVDPDKKVGMIIEFIKKYLKLDASEHLFLYVNQAFAPAPDQLIRTLYDCYEIDGKLILHYSLGQAWG